MGRREFAKSVISNTGETAGTETQAGTQAVSTGVIALMPASFFCRKTRAICSA